MGQRHLRLLRSSTDREGKHRARHRTDLRRAVGVLMTLTWAEYLTIPTTDRFTTYGHYMRNEQYWRAWKQRRSWFRTTYSEARLPVL